LREKFRKKQRAISTPHKSQPGRPSSISRCFSCREIARRCVRRWIGTRRAAEFQLTLSDAACATRYFTRRGKHDVRRVPMRVSLVFTGQRFVAHRGTTNGRRGKLLLPELSQKAFEILFSFVSPRYAVAISIYTRWYSFSKNISSLADTNP
jgi:hypothetical protein